MKLITRFFTLSLILCSTLYGKKEEVDYNEIIYKWSKPLAETFHHVHEKYYQETDPEKPMQNAINAFVKSLDPHSCAMNPKETESILETTKGELCGIGIIVASTKDADDEFVRVEETLPGGPADTAGIKAEDRIVEIDGQAVKGMPLDEAIAKLKGKRNTQVRVRVQRSDTTRLVPFTITRDIVKEPNALCYHFKDHNIYYLSLNMFTENSVKQVEQLLKKIKNARSKGLIIDLRNNTGGLLTAAIDIAGLFLQKNSPVVVTKGKDQKVIDRYITKNEPITDGKTPVFILVNNYTASAAEILAGTLKVYADKESKNLINPYIFVVGSKTFGKGSVQEIIPMSHDCALKLTVALYYLPNDETIQGKGIVPDFHIEPKLPPSKEMKWFNKHFGRESALKNTIKVHQEEPKKKEKKDPKKSWFEKKKELISSDYLILSTARLIEMLDMSFKAYPEKVKTKKAALRLLTDLYTPEDKACIEEITI